MVKIKKGKLEKKVARSAFHNFYENAGWHIVGNNASVDTQQEADMQEEPVDMQEDNAEEDWESVMEEEKPLNDMNKQELMAKAAEMGIDVSDCANNKQIRERIRSFQ